MTEKTVWKFTGNITRDKYEIIFVLGTAESKDLEQNECDARTKVRSVGIRIYTGKYLPEIRMYTYFFSSRFCK